MKECNSCGKCCIKYSNEQLSASEEEIKYWEIFRPEIAEYVSNKKIWASPETGKLLQLCPWLTKEPGSAMYRCEIYNDRPDDCRYYPTTIAEMIRDECEMIEPVDHIDHKGAQRKLDTIMADSRAPFHSK